MFVGCATTAGKNAAVDWVEKSPEAARLGLTWWRDPARERARLREATRAAQAGRAPSPPLGGGSGKRKREGETSAQRAARRRRSRQRREERGRTQLEGEERIVVSTRAPLSPIWCRRRPPAVDGESAATGVEVAPTSNLILKSTLQDCTILRTSDILNSL